MTAKQAIAKLRKLFGNRNEHHPNCSVAKGGKKCDCYAAGKHLRHKYLDAIEAELREAGK